MRVHLLTIIMLCLSSTCFANDIQSSLEARLLTEAPLAWRTLQEQARHIKCIVSETRTEYCGDNSVREGPSRTEWELDFNGNWFLFKAHTKNRTGMSVWARNSEYGFACGNVSKDETMCLDFRGTKYSQELVAFNSVFGAVVRCPFSLSDVPLTTIVADPSFHIIQLSSSMNDGRELVELEFTLNSAREDASDIKSIRKGSVTLVPDLQWCIVKSDVEWAKAEYENNLPPIHSLTEIKYNEANSNDPMIVEEIVQLILPKRKSSRIVWDWQIKEIKPSNSPEDVFRLPAYGLPEVEIEPKPVMSNVSLLIGLIAIACLVSAFIFRRWSKRLRSKQAE